MNVIPPQIETACTARMSVLMDNAFQRALHNITYLKGKELNARNVALNSVKRAYLI